MGRSCRAIRLSGPRSYRRSVRAKALGTMGNLSATLHMIVGLPCAGKSTYATALKMDTNAVLVSLDRWLITLFGRYSIGEIGHEEHVRRVLSTRALIWESSSEHLRRSVDVILDDGFFLREHRRLHIELATALGAASMMHFYRCARQCPAIAHFGPKRVPASAQLSHRPCDAGCFRANVRATVN